MDFLDPQTLATFSQISKLFNLATTAYIQVTWNLDDFLAAIFGQNSANSFYRLQNSTGVVMSGELIFSFMNRTTYALGSYLDLFVDTVYLNAVSAWITYHSATYRYSQEISNAGADAVLKFVKQIIFFQTATHIVRLYACESAPVEVILSYPLTSMMNIVADGAAYALFGRATFVDKRTMVVGGTCSHSLPEHLTNSEERWTIQGDSPVLDFVKTTSLFGSVDRRIGDKYTWKIPLSDKVNLVDSFIEGNTFSLHYYPKGQALSASISWTRLTSSALLFQYATNDAQDLKHSGVESLEMEPLWNHEYNFPFHPDDNNYENDPLWTNPESLYDKFRDDARVTFEDETETDCWVENEENMQVTPL